MTKTRKITAYYSRTGENYMNGNLVNLSVGNTEVVAKIIQKLTGSDIFHIDTVKSYPKGYYDTTDIAKQELRRNDRPELTRHLDNMAEYDVIYLGYPNWWSTMPMAIYTFLEEYDFTGKTIIPFCTHEGSGMGHSERDIGTLCPDARILSGLAIRGGSVGKAERDVAEWLKASGEIG